MTARPLSPSYADRVNRAYGEIFRLAERTPRPNAVILGVYIGARLFMEAPDLGILIGERP